jgi:N-acetylglutamate synthase-like GNAT family acetyltransferase
MPRRVKKARSRAVPTRVRVAKDADATALAEFFRRAWREAGPGALGFTGATDKAMKEIASEEFLVRRLKSPRVRIVIVERNRRVLGFASVRTLARETGELSGIVVLGSESGGGLGTRLVEKACKVAAEVGIRKMIVKTEVFNERAIGFYRKNGFAETSKATEKVGKMKVRVQVLEKRL